MIPYTTESVHYFELMNSAAKWVLLKFGVHMFFAGIGSCNGCSVLLGFEVHL